MTTALIRALSVLIKPIRAEATLNGPQPTQKDVLISALHRNLAEVKRMLDCGEVKEVHLLLEEIRSETQWFCVHTEDVTWSFVQECLLLLLCLARHLTRLLEAFNQNSCPAVPNPRAPEAAPPLPPDVLSVSQQKTISTVLQFLVTLGLCPYLLPGVGVSLALRSAFGVAVEAAVCRDIAPASERRLLLTTTALLEVAALSSLATLVFTRHLGDLIAALCQLGYRPCRPEGDTAENKGLTVEERKVCKQELQSLLGRVYQPIVIKELLALQGSPKAGPGSRLPQAPPWLRRLCGQLLSKRLMQPHGVQAVVRAIMEGSGGGDSDWRKCDAVAKILATCPQQSLSAESYYSEVCPQILGLFHLKDKITALQFQRVATRVVLSMVENQPEFAQRFLLSPLLSPLQHCASVPACVKEEEVVPESELTCCVEDVYKICVVGNNPSEKLLRALGEVIPTVVSLFCYTNHNVSHLRTPCQEILQWYLSNLEPSAGLLLLKNLCVMQGMEGGVAPGYHFSPGSEGGVRLSRKDPVSDEDDALYEKVSGDQWKVECVVQLLAQIKDTDLPGEFFLLLLQDLTDLAAEQHEPDREIQTSSLSLLELEKHLTGCVSVSGQRLALLQTLAFMCEILPHTQLLRKATQVINFIEAMLQRACLGLKDGFKSPVESQTLSMGMGLVATLLSEAAQLTPEDFSVMARLLPPLEQISQLHPEPVIQELASDLRATIATRGAYHSESVANAGQCYNHSKSAHTKNQKNPGKPSRTSNNPKTHVSQNIEMPHFSQQSPRIPSTSCLASAQSTASVLSAPAQNSAYPGTCSISTQIPASSHHTQKKGFSDWLLEACDPDIPTRAMALRALTQCVKEEAKEAVETRDKLLMVFLENVEHEDSFVYLSAIQGLVLLADSFPEQILQRLLAEYQAASSGASSSRGQCLETRLKVGEALMRASRAMGDLAAHYGRPLIGAFLSGTRDEDSSIRASCLSNLGELCQRLNFSLGPLTQELSMCLIALIKTEKEAEVRRAAVHVIALLLRGLSDKTTQVLGDVLLELYRALKWVVRFDSDEVAVLHAQLALEELDDVMRRFIFPQPKLEKKIVFLP